MPVGFCRPSTVYARLKPLIPRRTTAQFLGDRARLHSKDDICKNMHALAVSPPSGRSCIRAAVVAEKRLDKRFGTRWSTQEVLAQRPIVRPHAQISKGNLTFSDSLSSRLPPGRKIASRYRRPRFGFRGSSLNTVAYMSIAKTREYVKLRTS